MISWPSWDEEVHQTIKIGCSLLSLALTKFHPSLTWDATPPISLRTQRSHHDDWPAGRPRKLPPAPHPQRSSPAARPSLPPSAPGSPPPRSIGAGDRWRRHRRSSGLRGRRSRAILRVLASSPVRSPTSTRPPCRTRFPLKSTTPPHLRAAALEPLQPSTSTRRAQLPPAPCPSACWLRRASHQKLEDDEASLRPVGFADV